MKTSSTKPTVTTKFHIEVPTHTYGSPAAVYKIWFGQKYLIWKGKSLLQSCQFIAEGIERYIRLQKKDESDYLFHVCRHIKATRCQMGKVEVIDSEFLKGSSTVINGYKMLVVEQDELDKCSEDPMCLNNNEQAYIPSWVSDGDQNKFLTYYSKQHESN